MRQPPPPVDVLGTTSPAPAAEPAAPGPATPAAGLPSLASPAPVAGAPRTAGDHGLGGPPPAGERRGRVLGWRTRDVLRATALVVGFLLALTVLWVAREIFLTAFLGVLFGLAVGAGARQLARRRVP